MAELSMRHYNMFNGQRPLHVLGDCEGVQSHVAACIDLGRAFSSIVIMQSLPRRGLVWVEY